jgi:hypothetical protein
MPLNTPKLYNDIKRAFNAQKNNTDNQDEAIAKIAKDLSTAIDVYVRSATVVTNPGQLVTTATTAPGVQVGATTAPGTGKVT